MFMRGDEMCLPAYGQCKKLVGHLIGKDTPQP